MPSLCSACGAPLPGVGSFCPSCGTPASTPKPVLGTTGGIPDHIAGALAYVFVLPAIVFLSIDPFKRSRFLRFHSWQSILLTGVTLILFPAVVAVMSRVLMIAVGLILAVGWFILWLVLIVKALQGDMFELPWIGPLASRLAGPPPS